MSETKKTFWSPGRVLLLLMGLSLALRLLAALWRPMIDLDEIAYVRMAENLAHGKGLFEIYGNDNTYFAPLLPILISGLGVMLRNFVTAGYVVQAVFGTLMLVPVYLLGREFFNTRAGLMAAALVGVMPLTLDYSSRIYSESVYSFFLLMAVFFGWTLTKNRHLKCGVNCGLSLGMAYLANPAGLFYVAVIPALALLVAWRQKQIARVIRPILLLLAIFAVFAVPYVFYLHSQLGTWVFSGKTLDVNTQTTALGLHYQTVEWEQHFMTLTADGKQVYLAAMEKTVTPINYVLSQPVQALRNLKQSVDDLFNTLLPDLIPLWLLPLMGLGLFASAWSKRRFAATGYILLMTAPILVVLMVYVTQRFFLPYVTLWLLFVGMGWRELERWGGETIDYSISEPRREGLKRWAPWVVGAVVLLPVLAFAALTILKQDSSVQDKEVGQWIEQNAGADKRIMDRNTASPFYADGTGVLFPYADYHQTTDYAQYQNVDYLVISRSGVQFYRPQLSQLLGPESEHPEWKLVHVARPGTDRETFVFELAK